jgi:hypothetical protein
LRKDIPVPVSTAIDKALTRTPSLRLTTCGEMADTLEKQVRSIADPTELKWNMEVYRALSLFAPSAAPPSSATPPDSIPPPEDDWLAAPLPSRPSGTGPESKLGWKGQSAEPSGKGTSDDSVIQRLTDLFDALPADASEPGEPGEPADPEERTSVDAGWEIEDDTDERKAERFSQMDAPLPSAPRPRTTPAPATTEPEPATLPAGDSAPPTEPEPPTEPSLDEMRATRAERRKSPPPSPSPFIEPNIGTKTSRPPVSSEPVPSTEPEPGRMASPPPSLQSHQTAVASDAALASPPAPVIIRGVRGS